MIIGASRVVIKIGVAIGKNADVHMDVVVTKYVPAKTVCYWESWNIYIFP